MAQHTTPASDRFPSTHWSLVAAAGHKDHEQKRRALARLVGKYLPAMRTHLVLKKRLPPERADDLLQSFLVSKVLEQDLVARAERGRGRFRTFLLTALDRFALNQAEYERAKKRSPGDKLCRDAEWDAIDSAAAPDEAFDVEWARRVLDQAVSAMRRQCEESRRPDLWVVFEARVLAPTLDGVEPTPYGELAARFGWASPSQGSNVLVTANRMFVRVLRAIVGEYEKEPADVDAEIADLRRILSTAGARSC